MKQHRPQRVMVTRARLIRAFSSPARSRQEVLDLVKKYMGDSPVPPAWSLAGVRGEFGNDIARAWAKRVRHLVPATYRLGGRWVTPVVQSLHDFAAFRRSMREGQGKLSPEFQRAPVFWIDEAAQLPYPSQARSQAA